MRDRPFTACEVAARLGIGVEHFYRQYAALLAEGMPPKLRPRGRYAFDRADMERWLNPRTRGLVAANDAVPLQPDTIEDYRDLLARAYGGARV